MNVLLKMPTRGRPNIAFTALGTYLEKAQIDLDNRLGVLLSLDEDDATMKQQPVLDYIANLSQKYPNVSFEYFFGANKTKIMACNADMDKCKFEWDIIVLASDDMIPQVNGYNKIIADDMREYFPDLSGGLHYNDGRNKDGVCTLSIMGRKLYEYFGYIYHPDYVSLWCDTEYSAVAKHQKKLQYINRVLIYHGWRDFTGMDNIGQQNRIFNGYDCEVYNRRRSLGFPLHKSVFYDGPINLKFNPKEKYGV